MLTEHVQDSKTAHAAIFLLANLASGDDDCKEAVGNAAAPDALAAAVKAHKANAVVLRLTLGVLTQLAQSEAGRRFVVAAHSADAVVLARRRLREAEALRAQASAEGRAPVGEGRGGLFARRLCKNRGAKAYRSCEREAVEARRVSRFTGALCDDRHTDARS